MNAGAVFSPCYKYRYSLWRIWEDTLPILGFVMLNPSTADAEKNDATIRKCMGFARQNAYGGIKIANLYAWRATDPRDLWKVYDKHGEYAGVDAIGADNDDHITALCESVIPEGGNVVCAWGKQPKAGQRIAQVKATLKFFNTPVFALQLNNDGSPAHPLMLPYRCELREYAL